MNALKGWITEDVIDADASYYGPVLELDKKVYATLVLKCQVDHTR